VASIKVARFMLILQRNVLFEQACGPNTPQGTGVRNMKMQNVQKGFTLIELMIVIAIVGILAAIALPAYQDYTVRAKMAEPLAALSEAKVTLSEYYASNRRFPPNALQAGINSNPNKNIVASVTYVSSSSGQGAIITAEIKPNVIPGATSTVGFSLSSVTQSDGSVIWNCKQSVVNSGAATIEPKYLPSNCRT